MSKNNHKLQKYFSQNCPPSPKSIETIFFIKNLYSNENDSLKLFSVLRIQISFFRSLARRIIFSCNVAIN